MKAQVLRACDDSMSSAEWVRLEDGPDARIAKPTDVIVRIGGASCKPFEQRYRLRRIPRLAGGQSEAQGVAERVGKRVQLGGEPAP